jgi:hypothetical protein
MLSDSNIRETLGPLERPSDPNQPPPPAPRTGLLAGLVVLLVLLWGGGVALILHFERIAPVVPDPATNHVYRFSDTRHAVYLTAGQHYTAYTALVVPLLSTIVVGLFARPRKAARMKEPESE